MERLRAEGIDPYPPVTLLGQAHADRRHPRRARPGRARAGRAPGLRYLVAGRLISRRGHGKTAFLDLRDLSGSIQIVAARRRARRGGLRPHPEPRHRRHRRRRGVRLRDPARRSWRSRCSECTLLTKTLRPPPDKHHGLGDTGTRYRYRELDLIANEETRELFVTRNKIVARDPRMARRTQLRRGRNAGPAVARRRRRARGRSRPITTRSTATCTCASPSSCS